MSDPPPAPTQPKEDKVAADTLDLAEGMSAAKALDLAEGAGRGDVELNAVSQRSMAWANVARPFAKGIFVLVGLVILGPFLFVYAVPGMSSHGRVDAILDWAKTVLPPVIGFGSAVVGYYFGTASSSQTTETQPAEPD